MNSIKKTNKPGVVVLGGHVQGYGIVRIYGQNNIRSVVIDKTRYNIARHSSYCTAFHKIGYDELIDFLKILGKKGDYIDWLLMPTDDYYVRLLSQNKNELSKYFVVTVDDWEIINTFFNKKNSYPLAQAAGLFVPKTFYPKSSNDLKNIPQDINFPCIIKPAIMLDFYRHFKKKVFVCNDKSDLEKKFHLATQVINTQDILIQEIIPGTSEHQYSVGVFFDRDRSYNYLVAKRKRQHPIDFGNATTFSETVDAPVLVEYTHKILSKARFFGICEVEFKFDQRDNQYKFLEVNPRTWKWHLISQIAEIPFLLSLYRYYTTGMPIIKKDYKYSGWRDIVTDFPIIIKLLAMKKFTGSKNIKIIDAVENLVDIKPFLYQLCYLPYLFFKR